MYSKNDELVTSFSELQSDILGEKLTDNPKMKASKILAKNKALNTEQKTIINAINELLKKQDEFSDNVRQDLQTMYSRLGNFASSTTSDEELAARKASSVLELAVKAFDMAKEAKTSASVDHEDVFNVPEGKTQSEFKLTHRPIGKIRLYIDGIRYFRDSMEYNPETNVVTWTNDSTKAEGFDITDADVVLEYDYLNQEGET